MDGLTSSHIVSTFKIMCISGKLCIMYMYPYLHCIPNMVIFLVMPLEYAFVGICVIFLIPHCFFPCTPNSVIAVLPYIIFIE